MENKIQSVTINNLWGRINIHWDKIFKDVNIIVGINGIGKSTLLNAMFELLNGTSNVLEKYPLDYISIVIDNKEITSNTQENNYLVCKLNKDETSYEYILTKLKQYKEATGHDFYEKYIFFTGIVNRLFLKTKKQLDTTTDNNIQFTDSKNSIIKFDKLSSGEKKMLIFLYKVFLSCEKPYIFFLDEPELSLYVEWQSYLIDIIKKINPNCQLFIVTHSPNIFSNGWSSNIVYIEDYITEI